MLETVGEGGLPQDVAEIVGLRVSQINGCRLCVHGHTHNLRKAGASEDRISSVAAWREAPFFDDAERAGLKPAEAMTPPSRSPWAPPGSEKPIATVELKGAAGRRRAPPRSGSR
ncbi:carboxymuconolactone decarboxylase family protein [Streptomyces griseus]|uniref:carboxymuconolactone decarboxylase family protein n=1 Tax=Streptomyces griseus TaxID=1911 RepID=UPI001F25E6B6|nr:carboxymuconolactone decarboxylase family protein [Streptomyces griseus]